MKVECNKCGKSLNIPDEKIPSNKKVSVSCPACKNKIIVEKPPAEDKSEKPLSEATKTEEKENVPEKEEEPVKAMDPSEFADEELEVLEEGTKRALICDTVHQDKIAPVLKEMVYQPKAVASDSEAIGRMKFTQYDLVVLAEVYERVYDEIQTKMLNEISTLHEKFEVESIWSYSHLGDPKV
ncbi:MAG: zinc-ribbon domain-containing protein, partial [Nitrospinota bacterium]|nr:zinc-ribbon domain-containing protein [Nitrospinota bacterium]